MDAADEGDGNVLELEGPQTRPQTPTLSGQSSPWAVTGGPQGRQVYVASMSRLKVAAVLEIIARFLHPVYVPWVVQLDAQPRTVGAQPVGIRQTFQAAFERLVACKIETRGRCMVVALENGIARGREFNLPGAWYDFAVARVCTTGPMASSAFFRGISDPIALPPDACAFAEHIAAHTPPGITVGSLMATAHPGLDQANWHGKRELQLRQACERALLMYF